MQMYLSLSPSFYLLLLIIILRIIIIHFCLFFTSAMIARIALPSIRKKTGLDYLPCAQGKSALA